MERKEDSIYESGDSVTWKQITVLALTLNHPFNLGLATSATNNQVHTQFDEVLIQKDDGRLTQLPGDPNDLAVNVPLDIEYDPQNHLDTDYILMPEGFYAPKNGVGLLFEADATISEVNQVIAELNVEIIYFRGGRVGNTNKGILIGIRTPIESYEALLDLVLNFGERPKLIAIADLGFDGPLNSVPKPND